MFHSHKSDNGFFSLRELLIGLVLVALLCFVMMSDSGRDKSAPVAKATVEAKAQVPVEKSPPKPNVVIDGVVRVFFHRDNDYSVMFDSGSGEYRTVRLDDLILERIGGNSGLVVDEVVFKISKDSPMKVECFWLEDNFIRPNKWKVVIYLIDASNVLGGTWHQNPGGGTRIEHRTIPVE